MQQLMGKLNISETYTKPIKYKFPKVKNQVFSEAGYNYEADLLELPTTKQGYKSLLVIVDIYSNYFDIQPLKSKTAEFNGGEFKSVVDKYMYENNILHLWSLPDRHKQMGNVEN